MPGYDAWRIPSAAYLAVARALLAAKFAEPRQDEVRLGPGPMAHDRAGLARVFGSEMGPPPVTSAVVENPAAVAGLGLRPAPF
jgi:hypothetical protein